VCLIYKRLKIILTLLSLLVLPLALFSQLRDEINLPEYDDKLYHFGINLGVNKSHFNFTIDSSFLNPNGLSKDSIMVVESLNSTGINLAWLVNLNLSEHFDIRSFPLDLTFIEKAFEYALKYPSAINGETPITTKKVQSITLSLPIQIQYSSDRIDNFKVYTIAGIRFDYDLAANAGANNDGEVIKLKKFDYSAETGVGFHLYFPYFVLSPELKVSWGLTNLHKRDATLKYSIVIDKINSRMISFSLTVE